MFFFFCGLTKRRFNVIGKQKKKKKKKKKKKNIHSLKFCVVEQGSLLVEHRTPNREVLISIRIRDAVLELDNLTYTLCFEGPKEEDWC